MSWLLRKRKPSQAVTGANVRIALGEFGVGMGPMPGIAQVDPRASAGIYHYHEGDVFAPGTGNYVFEPVFELPLQTLWGFGFVRNPNVFNPFQPPQIWSRPNVLPSGIGGMQAGELDMTGLINPEQQSAPFVGDFAI